MDSADEPSPLDFDTIGGHLIDAYQTKGTKGLREWLAAYVATEICTKEDLQMIAAELAAMKAIKPARLVAKAALKCPPMRADKFCHYEPLPTQDAIWNHWRPRQRHKADQKRKRIAALLEQAGLTVAWLGDEELSGAEELTQAGELTAEDGKTP